MGKQATMTIGDKIGSTASTIATGGATYPGVNQVRIVTLVAVADEHRLADIQRTVKVLIDAARDNNVFRGSGSKAYTTTLNGGKEGIIAKAISADVVDGDIALMIVGTVSNKGNRNITEEAHIQLLDWMNETDNLI